jgi:hypothetical protein
VASSQRPRHVSNVIVCASFERRCESNTGARRLATNAPTAHAARRYVGTWTLAKPGLGLTSTMDIDDWSYGDLPTLVSSNAGDGAGRDVTLTLDAPDVAGVAVELEPAVEGARGVQDIGVLITARAARAHMYHVDLKRDATRVEPASGPGSRAVLVEGPDALLDEVYVEGIWQDGVHVAASGALVRSAALRRTCMHAMHARSTRARQRRACMQVKRSSVTDTRRVAFIAAAGGGGGGGGSAVFADCNAADFAGDAFQIQTPGALLHNVWIYPAALGARYGIVVCAAGLRDDSGARALCAGDSTSGAPPLATMLAHSCAATTATSTCRCSCCASHLWPRAAAAAVAVVARASGLAPGLACTSAIARLAAWYPPGRCACMQGLWERGAPRLAPKRLPSVLAEGWTRRWAAATPTMSAEPRTASMRSACPSRGL